MKKSHITLLLLLVFVLSFATAAHASETVPASGTAVWGKETKEIMTGWQKIDGKWYHFTGTGVKQTGWQTINRKRYYLGNDGAMRVGWKSIGGKWYHFAGNGVMDTGWFKWKGNSYFLGSNGVMRTGWQKIDGKWYHFTGKGAMQTGWKYLGGKWYYLASNGVMCTKRRKIDGKIYYLGTDGAMRTGWQKLGGKWYCFADSGEMKTGWLQSGGQWYYLNSKGVMLTGWQVIGSKEYYFNKSGAWEKDTPSTDPLKNRYGVVVYDNTGNQSLVCFESPLSSKNLYLIFDGTGIYPSNDKGIRYYSRYTSKRGERKWTYAGKSAYLARNCGYFGNSTLDLYNKKADKMVPGAVLGKEYYWICWGIGGE